MRSLFSTINLMAGFLAGILGALFVMLLGHPILEMFQSNNALLDPKNGSDVIAVANTYIVFTTFIFVLITIVITGSGIWFSRWFGLSKEKEIRENMRELIQSIDSDSELADKFVKELFENQVVADKLHKLVQVRVENEISSRASDNGENIDFSEIISQLKD